MAVKRVCNQKEYETKDCDLPLTADTRTSTGVYGIECKTHCLEYETLTILLISNYLSPQQAYPGLHRPKEKLTNYMNDATNKSVDVIQFMERYTC